MSTIEQAPAPAGTSEEDDFQEIAESDKTPVTIITGFLGSGKTTLVNYILKEQTKWKICVVENEFGEVAIDGDLVSENLAAREDIITMDNGCVCCSIRGDLVRTFATLINRRKEFDAIIIETTGVADPSPIIFTFNTNALIQDNYRIDSIVCLVDVKHVQLHLDEKKPDNNINEAEQQIAFADCIILNKLDLLKNADELQDIEDRIRGMNSFAKLLKTERSRAPLDQILGLNTFSIEKVVELDPQLLDSDDEDEGHSHEGHVHDEHCNHDHSHSSGGADHVHDEHCGHDLSENGHHGDHDHGHNGHESKKHHDHDHDTHGHDDHDHHQHGDHDHDHDHHEEPKEKHQKKKKRTHNLSLVSSVGFTISGLLDVAKFNTFMTSLLQAKAADLFRSKGVLAFSDQGDTKFVFQGVHEQINFGPSEKPWAEGEERISKMVFIGKNLDYEFLRVNLLESTTDPANAKITVHKRT